MRTGRSMGMDGLHGVCLSICLLSQPRAQVRAHTHTHTHTLSRKTAMEGHRPVRSLAKTTRLSSL